MKRILLLIDSLGAGGAQRQMIGLANLLKEKGHVVKLIYYHPLYFFKPELDEHGIDNEYIDKAQGKWGRFYFIHKAINRFGPEIVISYLDTPNICACFAGIFNRSFKLIVSERNTTQHTRFRDMFRFNLFRRADYIVPNSYAQAEYIKQTFPFLSNKIHVIPNFVSLEDFVPKASHIRHTPMEIMVAASIWPSKNTLTFIDAIAILKRKGYRFHVSWYGLNNKHVEYINQCIERIKTYHLEDCISLKEKTREILACYQESDYFCLPSLYEGTPNVLCEAMACGLPIACSNVCDNPRYVENGFNGFLFLPTNPESITEALGHLLSLNDEEYSTFCHQSRRVAESKLSKKKFIESYTKIIEL